MTTMTRNEELSSIYWDAYKDAHGVRPRGIDTSKWTDDQFMLALDDLQRIIDDSEVESKEDEARAIVKFEDSVLNLMHPGTNRARVVAWLMQEAGAEGDAEYFCFKKGLPYGYLTKA